VIPVAYTDTCMPSGPVGGACPETRLEILEAQLDDVESRPGPVSGEPRPEPGDRSIVAAAFRDGRASPGTRTKRAPFHSKHYPLRGVPRSSAGAERDDHQHENSHPDSRDHGARRPRG
jgi:hypothetical protein